MAKSRQYLSFNDSLPDRVSLDYLQESQEQFNVAEPLPLNNVWKLWVQLENKHLRTTGVSYKNNMKELAVFQTVQEFWEIWSQLPQPSTLLMHNRMLLKISESEDQNISALMIFKDGIVPMWEDESNKNGGHFECVIQNTEAMKGQADEYWNNLILALIGNTIHHGHLLTGVRLVEKLNSRTGGMLRIEIWYTKCDRDRAAELMASLEELISKKVDGSAGNKPRFETKSH